MSKDEIFYQQQSLSFGNASASDDRGPLIGEPSSCSKCCAHAGGPSCVCPSRSKNGDAVADDVSVREPICSAGDESDPICLSSTPSPVRDHSSNDADDDATRGASTESSPRVIVGYEVRIQPSDGPGPPLLFRTPVTISDVAKRASLFSDSDSSTDGCFSDADEPATVVHIRPADPRNKGKAPEEEEDVALTARARRALNRSRRREENAPVPRNARRRPSEGNGEVRISPRVPLPIAPRDILFRHIHR